MIINCVYSIDTISLIHIDRSSSTVGEPKADGAAAAQSLYESLRDERLRFLRELASNLSADDALSIMRKGRIHLGDYKLPGWKNPLPFYAFICERHGIVVSYPIGHMEKLLCPQFLEEE